MKFRWFCLEGLLFGDIEFKPGHTDYPFAVGVKGVEVKEATAQIVAYGCTQNVKNLQYRIQNTEYRIQKLSKILANDFNFTWSICLKENSE